MTIIRPNGPALFTRTPADRIYSLRALLTGERAIRANVFKNNPAKLQHKIAEINQALDDLRGLDEELGRLTINNTTLTDAFEGMRQEFERIEQIRNMANGIIVAAQAVAYEYQTAEAEAQAQGRDNLVPIAIADVIVDLIAALDEIKKPNAGGRKHE